MKYEDFYKKINLECYYNGDFQILTCDKTKTLIKSCNLVWIVPINHYSWNIEGIHGHNTIFKIAGCPATENSFLLHTQNYPVTIDQAEKALKIFDLTDNTFSSWISRFNLVFRTKQAGDELPKALWPIEYIKIPNDCGILRPAYQIKPDVSYLVITGIDRDCTHKGIRFPWRTLLE